MALLRRGDLSVTDVCFAVGCSSLGTFSSRFADLVGMPPSTYRRKAANGTAGIPSCVAKQVSRPVRNREALARRAPFSLILMDLTIYSTFLPHDDPEESLAFYRDVLGFEVRLDVGSGKMRWITVGPPGQPGTSIVLHPPAVDPGITDDERRTITEMMAKGTYAILLLASQTSTAPSPSCKPMTSRSSKSRPINRTASATRAFRDPAGNLIRIQEVR